MTRPNNAVTPSEVDFYYHDHAMVEPAGHASRQTQWHQDAPYWPMDPAGSLAAWIAVDDVTIENGCIQFVPGSHRSGKLADINPYHLEVEGESIRDQMKARGQLSGAGVCRPTSG